MSDFRQVMFPPPILYTGASETYGTLCPTVILIPKIKGLFNVLFQYISNKMQRYTFYLYLETALHVSGDTITHYHERINSVYSIWYLSDRYCYLLLAAGSSNGLTNTRSGIRGAGGHLLNAVMKSWVS